MNLIKFKFWCKNVSEKGILFSMSGLIFAVIGMIIHGIKLQFFKDVILIMPKVFVLSLLFGLWYFAIDWYFEQRRGKS